MAVDTFGAQRQKNRQYKRDPAGKFSAGEMARFSGKSLGGEFQGDADVKVIDPWSNKRRVTHSDSRGQHYEGASVHIPAALVEHSRKGREAMQFEAYHHNLSKISGR